LGLLSKCDPLIRKIMKKSMKNIQIHEGEKSYELMNLVHPLSELSLNISRTYYFINALLKLRLVAYDFFSHFLPDIQF